MVVLLRFLYLFLNIPIPLTIAFLNTLRTLLTHLIWAGKHPHIGLTTLMLPFERGGFGVPDFYLCSLVAQTHFAYFWYHPDNRIQYVKADRSQIYPKQLISLLPMGLCRTPANIETVATTCWAWDKLRRYVNLEHLYSPLLPLADNPWISPSLETLTKQTLVKHRLHTIGDLFINSHPCTVTEMISGCEATVMDRFMLHIVRSALMHILPEFWEEWPELSPLTLILNSSDNTHLVSQLYHLTLTLLLQRDIRARLAWEADIGKPLQDKEWAFCCAQTRYISPNYKHKLLHYKYIRRNYYTPAF